MMGTAPHQGNKSKRHDVTYSRHSWGPEAIVKPLCHHRKPRARNTNKLSAWNGLTAGPDIHRFSIGIFPQDLRGQVTWGASKTCSRKRQRHTEPTFSLIKSTSVISPKVLLMPADFTIFALSTQTANDDSLGFSNYLESKAEGKHLCLPGTQVPPQRQQACTADSSQTHYTESWRDRPGGTFPSSSTF